MSYFKYDNKNVFYYEEGEGKPLIFLHGNTASSNMFYEIKDKYKTDYKCILIDFLGHGQSDRLDKFPTDLWYDEALQVIELIKQMNYNEVSLLGSSGGAIVAINVALELPDRIDKVIADSFEGERALTEFISFIEEDREKSKSNDESRYFYEMMHGDDWEDIVDHDTEALIKHGQTIKEFYHKDISELKSNILFTGSLEDEFVKFVSPTYFEDTYSAMINKIGHGEMVLFQHGGHPAVLSNSTEFYKIANEFYKK